MSNNIAQGGWATLRDDVPPNPSISWGDHYGLQHTWKIFEAIETHLFSVFMIVTVIWYIVISATWNMKTCEEFWRYLSFLGILWAVICIKLKCFSSKKSSKESTKE